MNKIQQKQADFQKLCQSTKRLNKFIKFARTASPEQISLQASIELDLIEKQISTVKNRVVGKMLSDFKSRLQHLQSKEVTNA